MFMIYNKFEIRCSTTVFRSPIMNIYIKRKIYRLKRSPFRYGRNATLQGLPGNKNEDGEKYYGSWGKWMGVGESQKNDKIEKRTPHVQNVLVFKLSASSRSYFPKFYYKTTTLRDSIITESCNFFVSFSSVVFFCLRLYDNILWFQHKEYKIETNLKVAKCKIGVQNASTRKTSMCGKYNSFALALTLSWWRSLSYRNQSIDLLCKSMNWFLYDRDLRLERVKPVCTNILIYIIYVNAFQYSEVFTTKYKTIFK